MASASTLTRDVLSLYMVLVLVTAPPLSAIISSSNSTAYGIFEQWMAQYGASYKDATEQEKRFGIFQENLRYIEDFNSAGNRTYQLGLNKFSDLTMEEFRSRYSMKVVGSGAPNLSEATAPYGSSGVSEVPDNVNWVAKGALNSIQNQGSCACCWAFAAVGAMEAVIKIKTGVLKKLSEQQLVDCDTISHGCNKGWFQSGFEYVLKNGGISSGSNYPYLATQGPCNVRAPKVARISGWKNLPQNNEAEILKAVAQQPVAVMISGTSRPFVYYKGGILASNDCTVQLDHAVVIVGYGTSQDGTKYWLLRNSWGPLWGEGGYMRIAREVPGRPEGMCGLAINVATPFA